MLKNFKYYAGLLDSDGSVDFRAFKSTNGTYNLYTTANLSQAWNRRALLQPVADVFGVEVTRNNNQARVMLSGDKAVRFYQQISKHLVIKRELAEWVVSLNKTNVGAEELKVIRNQKKKLRADNTLSARQYPSRQWSAGYIDGDGCFTLSQCKRGYMKFAVSVLAHKNDWQGVHLLASHYGGSLNVRGDHIVWTHGLAKSSKILSDTVRHLKIKRKKADFLLDILRNGRHLLMNGATYQSNQELISKFHEYTDRND